VLVVDDEPAMVRAIERGLSLHHDVCMRTRGKEAVVRLSAGERFDVILSDLMMPEMTGMEFYEQITRVAPELADRIIFMTGGAFTPSAREFLERIPNAESTSRSSPRSCWPSWPVWRRGVAMKCRRGREAGSRLRSPSRP
jgi:CheY-like chemotaxis protein